MIGDAVRPILLEHFANAPVPQPHVFLLPSSARAPGSSGAFYTTALTLVNPRPTEVTFTLKLLGHDTDGRFGAEQTFSLAAGRSVTYARRATSRTPAARDDAGDTRRSFDGRLGRCLGSPPCPFDPDPRRRLCRVRLGHRRIDERSSDDPALAGDYDLAVDFEALHDLPRPVEAFWALRRMAGKTGAALMADLNVDERFTAPGGDHARFNYGWGVPSCLASGMTGSCSLNDSRA